MNACFRRPRLLVAALAALAPLFGGCAGQALLAAAVPATTAAERELASTPFFPQEAHQCGPAALATVLGASGVDTTPEALVSAVYVPALRGSLQVELVAASRRAGRIPYPIEPDLAALVAEVDAGRPVLVLQNLGFAIAPVWHYAVVVGYSQITDDVVLRSGRTEREVTAAARFARTWSRASRWGFVLLAPGELPVRVDHDAYVAALAAFESAGSGASALPAWQRASERWPDSEFVLLGFANALVAAGEPQAAERCYRALVERVPGQLAARNNLALVLAGRGCVRAALAMLEPAFAQAADDPSWHAILDDSRAEIAARSDDAERCARGAGPPSGAGARSAYAAACTPPRIEGGDAGP